MPTWSSSPVTRRAEHSRHGFVPPHSALSVLPSNGASRNMKQRVVTFMISAVLVAAGGEARALDSSLGVGLGYVKPKLLDATLWFTGDFRFQVFKGVFLAPEFGYWKKSTSVAQVTVSSEDLQFGIDAILVLRTGGTVELFAGGGGGMHHLTGDLAARGITAVS